VDRNRRLLGESSCDQGTLQKPTVDRQALAERFRREGPGNTRERLYGLGCGRDPKSGGDAPKRQCCSTMK